VQRAVRIVSTMLITAGILVLADAGLTLIWQEPLSAAYGSLEQGKAEDQLNDLEAQYPSPADLAAIAGVGGSAAKASVLADRFEPHLQEGHAIGRIKIDRIGLNMVVVQVIRTGVLVGLMVVLPVGTWLPLTRQLLTCGLMAPRLSSALRSRRATASLMHSPLSWRLQRTWLQT
jgi:hypothetical protein